MTSGLRTRKRPTVGLLISNTSDVYTRQIWPGISYTLREKDIHLIVFSGNPVFAKSSLLYHNYGQDFSLQPVNGFDYQSNVLYELINPETVDALVMTTGSLSYNIGGEELERFLGKLGSIPKVSIAIPLDGIPSVLVDNKKGISETVDHLVVVHGFRRIAFIRGPENHREAEDRFTAYLESLERHGIARDPSIIYPGDFMWNSGMEAAKAILEPGKEPVEAVICANDSMAIAAMSFFQSRGIRVPEDIAVTGFDNIERSRYSLVPLSTVHQPFYRQANVAAEIAADLAYGRKAPESTVLPAEFIPRASCGCLPRSVQLNQGHAGRTEDPVTIGTENEASRAETEKLESLFRSSIVDSGQAKIFLEYVNQAAAANLTGGKDPGELVIVMTRIKNAVVATLTRPEELVCCERLYQNAVILLGEKAQIAPGIRLIEYNNINTMLVSVMHGIMSKVQISDLMNTIARELPRLDIPGCAIALYESPWNHSFHDEWKVPAEIDLAMSFDQDGRNEPSPGKRTYPTNRLLPEGFFDGDKRHSVLVEALYFAEEQLGLIFFEMGKDDGMVYELLRLQISNTIKGSLVLRHQQTIQKNLQNHILTMDSELDLARKMQFKLIPEKSILPDVSFYYQPMAKIGGDFFDFIQFRNPDLTGFFISDVSGHGVPAALVTSMIKTTLLQIASSSKSPSEVLRQLNKILISQSPSNFITAFYGILNRKKRELEYSFAGHNAPLLIAKNGITALPSAGKGLPLAILDNPSLKELRRDFTDQKIVLEKGSKIFLYTDGLTEAVNVNEKKIKTGHDLQDFEAAEFFAAIDRNKHLPNHEFIDKMTTKLRHFRGSDDYDDDVCMICIDIP